MYTLVEKENFEKLGFENNKVFERWSKDTCKGYAWGNCVYVKKLYD